MVENLKKHKAEYLPKYYLESETKNVSNIKKFIFQVVKFFLVLGVRMTLNIKGHKVKNIDKNKSEELYARQAKIYNYLHHITTRGQDLMCRRKAGFFVANYLSQVVRDEHIHVLDLCTGTGLTTLEICKVLEGFGVESGRVKITGLDFSTDMLVSNHLR